MDLENKIRQETMEQGHFLNLDILHEYEWTKETEDECRNGFHENLMRIKRCHIWREKTFCFCTNGKNGDPSSHKAPTFVKTSADKPAGKGGY